MTPGPMDFRGPVGFRGPSRGPMGFQRAHGLSKSPSKWHWEISMWKTKDLSFCFLEITSKSGQNWGIFPWRPFFSFFFLFFWSHQISDKTVAFSPSVLEFTKPETRNSWADPGPTFGSRRPSIANLYCQSVYKNKYSQSITFTMKMFLLFNQTFAPPDFLFQLAFALRNNKLRLIITN